MGQYQVFKISTISVFSNMECQRYQCGWYNNGDASSDYAIDNVARLKRSSSRQASSCY